jgi:hypothetical protein
VIGVARQGSTTEPINRTRLGLRLGAKYYFRLASGSKQKVLLKRQIHNACGESSALDPKPCTLGTCETREQRAREDQ